MSKRKKHPHKNTSRVRPGMGFFSARSFCLPAGAAVLILAAFFAYLPSINGGFILDDDKLLTDNRLIRDADGLYSFWCTTKAQDYWPVSNSALWIEWRLWGMNPTGYHVINLLLHISAALLLWAIFHKLCIPGAFLAALIFIVHPVNVESVAWIAQRKGLLAMVFFLLSVLCYLKFEKLRAQVPGLNQKNDINCPLPTAHRPLFYWLSLLAFVLAMLSKGSVAILPVLLLGIVWWGRKATGWDLLRIAPFFVVAGLLVGVNLWFQTHGTGMVIREVSAVQRLLGAGGVVWFYLYKAFLPIDLALIYPQWRIAPGNLSWWLPLVAALAVTALLWWFRKTWSRPFLFAWGFFCVSLVPVLGITDVGFMQYSLVADHYQHLAIIGAIALAAAGWDIWRQRLQGSVRTAATIIAVLAASALAFLTWRQCSLYSDAFTLYQAALEKNPDCSIIHNNLGIILTQAGRIQEGNEHFQQALRVKPDDAEAHNNLGNVLDEAGQAQEAMKHYREALRLKPDYVEAHFNLGLLLANAGQLPEAIEHYQKVISLRPDYLKGYNNLGAALIQTGRFQEAIECLKLVLRLQPDYAEAQNNLGVALEAAGRLSEAIEQYRSALRLNPDYAEAENNLGRMLVKTGPAQEAIAHFQRAIRLQGEFPEAYYNMAMAYVSMKRSTEAVAAAQKALETAHSKGKTELAKQIEDWLKSYRAGPSGPADANPAPGTDSPRP